MPFIGKSTSSDYGNFMGMKDKPITIHRHLNGRSPLGPQIALYGDTEYNSNMISHGTAGKQREPKLKLQKESVKPFHGNYDSVYQDYVDHKLGEKKQIESQLMRSTIPKEKEPLIVIASRRVLQDPVLGPQVLPEVYKSTIKQV